MATKSILKDINIRNRTQGKKFLNALEHAENKKSIAVTLSKPLKEINKEQIKSFFGKDKEG